MRTGSGDSLLNEEPEHLGLNPTLAQTCGFQYLGMYDTGNYSLVGKGQNEAMGNDDCKGWEEPVPSKSGFLDDGRVGVLCNFRRPFGALCTDEEKDEQGNCPGWQQDLQNGQKLDLIAGFNIYHSETSDYRYAYGWSPDSHYRSLSWKLGGTASFVGLATAVLAVLITF